jgi:hypothetical protein
MHEISLDIWFEELWEATFRTLDRFSIEMKTIE